MFASSVRICGVGCSGCLYNCVLSLRKSVRLSIPSSCGMFVYSEDTSIDASMQFGGNFSLSIVLIKEVESCMYDGSCFTMVVASGLQMLICFLLYFRILIQSV